MIYTGPDGKGILENIAGGIMIAALTLTSPLMRGWYMRWGAADEEARRTFPGDERIPHPKAQHTRAITIRAPIEQVWPWVVQIGQGRGGLYSYELLENLIGCKLDNANRILPEFQTLSIGDPVRLGPEGYPYYLVAEIVPGQRIVLVSPDMKTGKLFELTDPPPAAYTIDCWIIVLEPVDAFTTRLIYRGRLDYEPTSFMNRLIWRVFTEPIGFVMMRRMLIGIKQRAEVMAKQASSAPVAGT